MLISGSERSPVDERVPPLRWAIMSAVSGVICIRPRAPALRLLVRKRDSA